MYSKDSNDLHIPCLLRADGSRKELKPKNGRKFSLKEMQTLVGGLIEFVPTIRDGFFLVIDEEGKLKDKELNIEATEIASIRPGDFIVGDALLISRKHVD